jgi:hypothetical protein
VGQAVSWHDVTIAIPTMPQRVDLLVELVEELRRHCEGAAFVLREHVEGDPPSVDFPAVINEALKTDRPWVLQVEDDAWPCPAFGYLAAQYLATAEAYGIQAVQFFSRHKQDLGLYRSGVHGSWRKQPPAQLCMIQAVAVRSYALSGFPEWAPQWYAEHPQHVHAADTLLGAWLSRKKARVMVTVPSLVQHRAVPSTLPHRGGARQSETYRLAFGEPPAPAVMPLGTYPVAP